MASDSVEVLHADTEREARRLHVIHEARSQCRPGCSACCVDDLTVFAVEAAHIRAHHGALLEDGMPHIEGACAFLDADASCRVYEHRPYVCRTQGLPLRWLDEADDGELTEFRDICPLNEVGEPVESLAPDQCWTLGPTEARLSALQHSSGYAAERVALRSLFRHQTAGK